MNIALTLTLLAILAVALFAAAALSRIERQLAAWQKAERRKIRLVAFTPKELARQRRCCDDAALKVQRLSSEVQQRWGGQTIQPSEERDFGAQSRELESLIRSHNGEVRHLSMMVRANARVRTGRVLLSDAINQVHADYVEQMHSRLRTNLDAVPTDEP